MKKHLAIITARGGSKRIHRKNIKDFCGRPIIAYSIEAALNSNLFDEVMVSTEDKEIAEISIKEGAKVPFMRSEEAANDFASTADVVLEVLDNYKKLGREFDTCTYIHPTAPFITAERLREGINLLEKPGIDYAFPVVAFSFPPQRALIINGDKVSMINPEHRFTRSQDLPKWYHDCGQFGMCNVPAFLKSKALDDEFSTAPIIVPETEVQDIDYPEDWEMAELKYIMLQKKKKAQQN